MSKKLQILAGAAMFAALALAGALGIFAFSGAQPVHAQTVSSDVTRDFSATQVDTGGTVDVTITLNAGLAVAVTETLPNEWDYQSAMTSRDSNPMVTESGQMITFDVINGEPFTYTVMAPSTDGRGMFSGMFAVTGTPNISVGGDMYVTVGAGDGGNGGMTPMPGMVDVSNAMVTARPDDPGDATQITVTFKTGMYLDIDESITLEVGDDMGVPSSIDTNDVSIGGNASAGDGAKISHEVASPRSVIVEEDSVAETFLITLFIGDMNDDDGPEQGLAAGDVRVTFRQGAGLTNRTEGGSDDWFVMTSAEVGRVQIPEDNVYSVPWTISLSSYEDSRGEQITAIGKGFKNGTTTRFWRDANRNGMIDSGETVLCSPTADGDDIATCDFTLSNPPFAPGKMGNYVNAIDGRGKTAGDTTYNDDGTVKSERHDELKQIELEPSMSVSPKQGIPGDSVNVQLHDFQTRDVVTKIEFSRTVDICDDDAATTAIPTCDSIGARGAVGDNGSLSFSFTIPNSVTPGAQDLKVHTTNGDDNTTFVVGSGELQLSTTDVLPNQRISISGSGFTKSANQDPAYIGDPGSEDSSCPMGDDGAVTLGGQAIPWSRINDGDGIEVTSGGTWSAPLDLPINASTTSAGTRELKITDCRGGLGTVDLTFAERSVTMTPSEGGVGTEIVITGKNYPVSNDDSDSDNEVMVEYDAGVEKDDDDIEPDALGNFTVILEVPEDANIPSNNTVSVLFHDDLDAQVLDTFTHRVPQGTVAFSASRGGEGSSLTITANGFARYTRVDLVEFGDREITPSPNPSTDTSGNADFSVRIPGSDPGIYIIRVEIDKVVATSTFTVVSGSGVSDGAVETVLGNIISADALDRVFRFDNTTKMWAWYISDPAFASTNNLGGLSSGDLVYIKVTKDVSADILGASTTLTCTNAGTDTEDCWNLVAIP